MDSKSIFKEIATIILVAIVIGISFSYPAKGIFLEMTTIFVIILGANYLGKKFFAYNIETDVTIKPWSIYQYGLRQKRHFKRPVTMLWFPILTSLISRGYFIWLSLIEFDVKPRPERVSRRHGLYRYTEVTEWHVALIAVFGIIVNIVLGVIGYLVGFEQFTKYSLYFAFYSMLPISSLDGSKIFFGSRNLWFTFITITLVLLAWGLAIH